MMVVLGDSRKRGIFILGNLSSSLSLWLLKEVIALRGFIKKFGFASDNGLLGKWLQMEFFILSQTSLKLFD